MPVIYEEARCKNLDFLLYWKANCVSCFKQDECSFVSLRDVERAMIVFGYFLETYISQFKAKCIFIFDNKNHFVFHLARLKLEIPTKKHGH